VQFSVLCSLNLWFNTKNVFFNEKLVLLLELFLNLWIRVCFQHNFSTFVWTSYPIKTSTFCVSTTSFSVYLKETIY
jgi:hypothetical protein